MTVPPPPGGTPPPPPPPPMPPVPPAPGMPPMPPSGGSASNGMATTSLILGIVSLLCGWLTGIPGLIFGILGKKKANEVGVGGGQATAGIVLSIIGIVLGIIGFILLFVVGNEADNSLDEATREFNKASEEIEAREARNGDVVPRSEFDVTEATVDASEFGSVTYEAYFENKGDFESDYTIKVECETDSGESDTETTYAYTLSPGNRDKITAFFSFSDGLQSANCSVTDVRYGF